VNCAIERLLRATTPAEVGLTVPFRSTHVTAWSGSDAFGRPPRLLLDQTPPSLPMSTCAVFAGLKTTAWKSGCWSQPRFFHVWPPVSERKIPPDPMP